MGVVYEAVHTKLNQRVAIKAPQPAILAQPALVERFEREARAAARLRHRNAVRVVDVDVTETGLPYMVMELLQGHDLETELSARGPLPLEEAVGYVLQACVAMVEAHARGIVHRDLKPSNLFLNNDADGTTCLKVLDYGVSKIQSENVRVTGTQIAMGTPLYMSPEQVRSAKHVDGRTDIWSLGVILYELLTTRPPFTGSPTGVGAAIVTDSPTSLRMLRPDAPVELEKVVLKAMAKNPAERYASMKDLALALAPFAGASAPPDVLRWSLAHEIELSSMGMASSTEETSVEISVDMGAAAERGKPQRSKRVNIGLLALFAILIVVGVLGLAFRAAPPSAARESVVPSAAAATRTDNAAPSANSMASAPIAPVATVASDPTAAAMRPVTTARPHVPSTPVLPKTIRTSPPVATPSAKTAEPSRKGWDNDSPLPPP